MLVHARRVRHTSKRPPDILCRSFTRLSTALAVIEGLGTRLVTKITQKSTKCPTSSGLRTRLKKESVKQGWGGCYVKPCKSQPSLSLGRRESGQIPIRLLYWILSSRATNEVGVNINWYAFWEGWSPLLCMKRLAL